MYTHSLVSVLILALSFVRISCFSCVFFFFQAEDGIRDHCVTGVQTCALPICRYGISTREKAWRPDRDSLARLGILQAFSRVEIPYRPAGRAPDRRCRAQPRSEERRVGKEGRSRWSPYH